MMISSRPDLNPVMAKNNFLLQPGTENLLFSQQPITTLSELPVLRITMHVVMNLIFLPYWNSDYPDLEENIE